MLQAGVELPLSLQAAAGCNGPTTATHTVTVTPTVALRYLQHGQLQLRCQGAGTVTYTATATNTTGITYSLDAASVTGGNTINTATGAVTYVAGWSGTSIITASAQVVTALQLHPYGYHYTNCWYTCIYIGCNICQMPGSRNCYLYCNSY